MADERLVSTDHSVSLMGEDGKTPAITLEVATNPIAPDIPEPQAAVPVSPSAFAASWGAASEDSPAAGLSPQAAPSLVQQSAAGASGAQGTGGFAPAGEPGASSVTQGSAAASADAAGWQSSSVGTDTHRATTVSSTPFPVTPGPAYGVGSAAQSRAAQQGAAQQGAAQQVQYVSWDPVNSTGQGTYPSAPQEQLYMFPEAIYPMTREDRTLRQIAFILNIISCVSAAVLLIPLAWMIPMTVMSYNMYKGRRQVSTSYAVCDLIFLNLISGILLLCGTRE